ncbi:neprilysin-1 [Verticillium alfalfae VaMs.102]|uniref:Neprilysin-1 n=1 Tax=Verticillium alfalfae (strain VaMs.102 / ATCC MYA-4576 / FGSC 10136) TaxID=526221 RepID=C9SBV7_VERA1|nr:neprilysin-1 [Verticillium alfalfae VaMs.102]EEY15841.1 neprilysin-1 [Verticillium alfalfae VaMs.102]
MAAEPLESEMKLPSLTNHKGQGKGNLSDCDHRNAEAHNAPDPEHFPQKNALLPVTREALGNLDGSNTRHIPKHSRENIDRARDDRDFRDPEHFLRSAQFLKVAEVNAYHIYEQNKIVFPAGIMQSPFFGLRYPEYVNYGSQGMLASHEISHGFDNFGRHYDELGNKVEWWDNATIVDFEKRAQCFIDQYDQYQIINSDGKAENITGISTQAETIADAGGILLQLATSFRVWKKREAEAPSQRLPALESFTPAQLFFVAFGNRWCSKSQPEVLEKSIGGSHPPDRASILYTVANSTGFLEAFNCPKKDPTCELW